MVKNYLIIAWRNLLKNKALSFMMMLGLTLGMAAFTIIMMYVHFEESYDQFHKHAADIYRVPLVVGKGDGQNIVPRNFSGAGPDLKEAFPEVLEYTRLRGVDGTVAFLYQPNQSGEPVVFNEAKIYFAEPSVFNVFDITLLEGDAVTALSEPNTLLLSESAAQRYFGNQEVQGKELVAREYGLHLPVKVVGVFKDFPDNSHFKPDFLWSYASQYPYQPYAEHDWQQAALWYTYVLLAPGTDVQALTRKFPDFLATRTAPEAHITNLELQALTDIHLHSNMVQELEVNGNGNAIYFLWAIALVVIVIAWVNYINLTMVRSAERAQEVGVRKTSGATYRQLIQQFVLESLLINTLSLVLAIGIVYLTIPYFSRLSGAPLSMHFSTEVIKLLAGIFVSGTLLSSLYPAWILSSLQPAHAVKGNTLQKKNSGVIFRKTLVTFQFAASIILMAGTFIVFQQLQYLQNQDLGMDINQVLVIRTPDVVTDSTVHQDFEFFRQQLEQQASISQVAATTSIPGRMDNLINGGLRQQNAEKDQGINFYFIQVDHQLIPALNFNFLAGGNFTPIHSTNHQGLILNQEALQALGFPNAESAIGEKLSSFSWQGSHPVIGVVENFHQESLKNQDYPIVMFYNNTIRSSGYYCVKIQGEHVAMDKMLATIENAWQTAFPDNPFDYFFLDTYYNNLYQADYRFQRVFGLFTFLAIFIACLGLLALSAYTVLQRSKEIGVRKVLGASVGSILMLLSKEYIKLILIAFAVAIPLTNYFMREWLDTFAFRISIHWWLFALPGMMVLFIALLSVSSQSWKAARRNPVDSLRYE
uniref:ABC transporter permease n=1 Tax=Roseihalotalea indica TaxID=2867963 RepID=A0AA49GMB3_9BACT|nr:ABC transporter permease [Tunicatimonas sp. TK19036]